MLQEVIEDASARIESGRFDPVVALNQLGAFEVVPDDTSDELIEQLFATVYECIPDKDYDISDSQAKQNHMLAILMLLKFMKEPTVSRLFDPNEDVITRMKLSKMIREGDSQMYETGLKFMSFIQQHCDNVLPTNLLEHDEESYAIVQMNSDT